MNLGESIYRQRTLHNMSQGDLADALDVSRQSVSKWENNMAVPELDKLMKMSELFGISLDVLVHGEDSVSPQPPADFTQLQKTPSAPVENALPPRKIAGIILFCMAFLTELVCTALGGMLEGLIFASPFVLCGLICFLFKKHVGLWCAWTVFAIADIYLHLFTGANRGFFNLLRLRTTLHLIRALYISPVALTVSLILLILLILLFVLTLIRFRKMQLAAERKRILLLVAGWILWAALPWILTLFAPG